MRTAVFWTLTQRVVVIRYRRFGITSRDHLQGLILNMGPTGCPETSVRNYHYSLRKISEDRSFLQISAVHVISTDFFKVYFNILYPSTPGFSTLFLSFNLPTKIPYVSVLPHTCYMYCPRLSSWVCHPDNV
jgi:hypothetical protein